MIITFAFPTSKEFTTKCTNTKSTNEQEATIQIPYFNS